MKKYFILICSFVLIYSLVSWNCFAVPPSAPTQIPKLDTNCNQAKYFPLGTLCQDSDDGNLYKGTGAAVEEIASGASYDDTGIGDDTTIGIDDGSNYTTVSNSADDDTINELLAAIDAWASGLSLVYHPLWDYDYGDLINTPTIPTVNDSITDSNTTSAPSENAVFDALALKAPINNPTFTGGISIAGTTAGGQYMFLREDTDNTADNYTGWGIYGELSHDTIYALPLAAPVTGQVISFATPGNQTMSDGSTQSISVGTFAYKDYAQTPVIGDADDFDDNCTGACLYGGTFIVTAAGTAVLPNATAGMNFTIILEGANATIIDPLGTGTADAIHMNGLAAADDENITSSTSGATCVIQYRSADHWSATCNGFAEVTPP